MKNFISIILAIVMCLTFSVNSLAAENSVQGRYLREGGCMIYGRTGYVLVSGDTEAYEDVDEITVELVLYQQVSSGIWEEVWSDSKTAYGTDIVEYFQKSVYVDAGKYKLEGIYTVKKGSVVESNSGTSNSVTVS